MIRKNHRIQSNLTVSQDTGTGHVPTRSRFRPSNYGAVTANAILLLCIVINPAPAAELLSESEFFGSIPPITSVTLLPQPRSETPAAITVIDSEMIRATGAYNLVDLMRLVPGFMVAYPHVDTPTLAYHGIAERLSRRMLILIDGRSSYGAFIGNINWINLNLAIDDIERHQFLIDNDIDQPFRIVDHAQGGHRARLHAKRLFEQIRLAETKAGRTDPLVEPLHVDRGVTFRHNQEQPALGILQKKVLGVPARDIFVEDVRLGNRENRLMLDRFGRNAELFETLEEFVAGHGHG